MMGCYSETLAHLSRIGTRDKVEISSALEIPFTDVRNTKTHSLHASAWMPAPFHILAALLQTALLSPSEKLAATLLGTRIQLGLLPAGLSKLTCASFFTRTQQPIGLVRKLWEPIVLATLNASVEQASASLFVSVFRIALLERRQNSSLVFPLTGLSDLLITPAIAKLERAGGSVRYGSSVTSISKNLEGKWIVVSNGESELFDAVVIASPRAGIALPAQVNLPSISYSPIVNAYFWVDRPIVSSPIQAFIGTTLQWAFAEDSHFCAQRLALTVSAAGEIVEQSNDELTALLWNDLQRSIPLARTARLLHSQIIRERRATPLFTPEAQNARPSTRTEMPGLYLAGDLVQNGLPATIEGAIRNGTAAARALIQDRSDLAR